MKQYTIHVGSQRLTVAPLLSSSLMDVIQKKLRFRITGYEYTDAHKKRGWDGYIQLFRRKDQTAPAGCFQRIGKLLKKEGYEVRLIFEKNYEPIGDGKLHNLDFELEKFQIDGINRAPKAKYCVISAPVRAGKTVMIAGIIAKVGHYPVWVVTHGNDLVLQIKTELGKFLNKPIGSFSEGKFDEQDIIVVNYQAIKTPFAETAKTSEKIKSRNAKIRAVIRDAKVLILDECHHALSEKMKDTMAHFENIGYKVGLSGTPKPDDIRKLEVEAAIGPTILKIPFSKLIESGRLAKPLVIMYDLPYAWYRLHLPKYEDRYEANIVQNHYRNRFIAEIVKNLQLKNKTAFIVVAKLAHGENLRELIPGSRFVRGEIKSQDRKSVYNELEQRDLHCIIATVGKEGLDLPKLNAVINAEGYEANTATIQKMRSLTSNKDKKFGMVIDFLDKGKDIYDHSLTRMVKYESLDGFIFKRRRVKKDHFKAC